MVQQASGKTGCLGLQGKKHKVKDPITELALSVLPWYILQYKYRVLPFKSFKHLIQKSGFFFLNNHINLGLYFILAIINFLIII